MEMDNILDNIKDISIVTGYKNDMIKIHVSFN